MPFAYSLGMLPGMPLGMLPGTPPGAPPSWDVSWALGGSSRDKALTRRVHKRGEDGGEGEGGVSRSRITVSPKSFWDWLEGFGGFWAVET
jgi:hypothetical protein